MVRERDWSIATRTCGAALLAVLLAVAPTTTAGAETGTGADLAGVTGVRITVSQTTPDAMACGIDLRDMIPLVTDGLSGGGLAIDPAAEVTVTLSVLTGYDSATGVCASAPMLGAYRRVSYFDENAGWLRSGQVVLWQRGTATATASADHPGAAQRAVSELSKAFLSSWQTDNAAGLATR